MNNKIVFTAELQQMAESEVLSMIPSDTLNRIRANDPHPLFKVFSIGHEGEAKGANLIGFGSRFVRWARDVVIQMFNKIGNGVKVFHGHQSGTNAHSNREVVGELVGKTMKEIRGVLHTLGAVYIKPEFRSQKLDVASLEGFVEFGEHEDGNIDVLNVSQITGIAVDDGNHNQPAMPGATLQAALQMFTQTNKGEFQQMKTKDEVKAAIQELGLNPTDVFSEDAIIASEPAKKAKQTEYEHAKRLEKRLGEAREENAKLQGDFNKLQTENATLQEVANKSVTSDVLKSISEEKKLDPKFVQYIQKNLKDFKSDKKEAEFKTELEKFVDTQAKDYQEMGKLYNFDAKITAEEKGGEGGEGGEGGKGGEGEGKEKGGAGTPSSDGSQKETPTGDKYTDPKQNDLIPAE